MSKKTFYTAPAKKWTEALPLGNGRIGASVFGGVKKERITLNHDTLWSGRPKRAEIKNFKEGFEKAKELLRNGERHACQDVLQENCLGGKCETYLTFGEMNISFKNGSFKNYKRTLDLENSISTVEFESKGVSYKREYFVSYPDDVFVIRLSASEKGKISCKISLSSPLKSKAVLKMPALFINGECPGESYDSETFKPGYKYFEETKKKGVHFSGGVLPAVSGGNLSLSEKGIKITDADEAVIFFTIKTNYEGAFQYPGLSKVPYFENAVATLNAAAEKGYENILSDHIGDVSPLFNKLSLDLGKSDREDIPTDKRLKLFKKDPEDISLYTLLFNFGRYLIIASSRKGSLAANLQGIWNDSMNPPWNSDYHININLQMNYWPVLMSGLTDCYEPLINYISSIAQSGKETAKILYGYEGAVLHHGSDIWAHSTPLRNHPVYGYWHGGGGWMCQHLYTYYEYTGDEEFLRNTAYPIMKDFALFYLNLLEDRGDGVKSVFMTTSPENMFMLPAGKKGKLKECSVSKSSTMSDAIAFELFDNCLKAINILKLTERNFKKELKTALSEMKPFSVANDGRLLEWDEDFIEKDPLHRHASHLYGLHPASLITTKKTPELVDACRKTLESRGDGGTGWSLAWKVNFFARLGMGEKALKLINMQLSPVKGNAVSYKQKGGTYPNMFDAHPPFQIDGNFGVVSGIIEMLIRYEDGKPVLLPALPEKWAKKGSLKGVRVKGGKICDLAWENGSITEFKEYTEK